MSRWLGLSLALLTAALPLPSAAGPAPAPPAARAPTPPGPPASAAIPLPAPAASAASEPPTVLLVLGAVGAPAYAARFRETVAHWQKAAARARAVIEIIGNDNDVRGPGSGAGAAAGKTATDKSRLQRALRDASAAPASGGALWLVLIGHGTHDGRQARFNLRGPDLAATELAAWCKSVRRPLVLINGASASAPFLPALTGPQRIVVTATKSGSETSAPRFGGFFAEAIADARADLDRDGGTSVLEAFLHASKRVEASFNEEGLLASEHALLEDNGDGLGTSPGFFRGLVASPTSAADVARDGSRARQVTLVPAPLEQALPPALRRRRDQLELAVGDLREQRPKLADAVYYARLEQLLLQLARLYRQAGQLSGDDAAR